MEQESRKNFIIHNSKFLTPAVAVCVILVLTITWFALSHGGKDVATQQPVVSEEELRGGTIEEVEAGKKRYSNTEYGFSFIYPDEYTVGAFEESGAGDVILVQKESDKASGFQVFVSPFDEEWPITPERIKEDVPELAIREPQYVVIGDGSIEALIFVGESDVFSESREVWFLWDGYLYQVTTGAGNDAFIGPMLESWRFENI